MIVANSIHGFNRFFLLAFTGKRDQFAENQLFAD